MEIAFARVHPILPFSLSVDSDIQRCVLHKTHGPLALQVFLPSKFLSLFYEAPHRIFWPIPTSHVPAACKPSAPLHFIFTQKSCCSRLPLFYHPCGPDHMHM